MADAACCPVPCWALPLSASLLRKVAAANMHATEKRAIVSEQKVLASTTSSYALLLASRTHLMARSKRARDVAPTEPSLGASAGVISASKEGSEV